MKRFILPILLAGALPAAVCPVDVAGLELMVPWQFVKSVVTAADPPSTKIFGLVTDLVKPDSGNK